MNMNKKGAEMTVGTLIIIILAIVVLIVLVFGFTQGWGNLWAKISNFFGGGSNVQTIIQACQIACSTNQKYDYCELERKVNFGPEDPRNEQPWTCDDLQSEVEGLDECDNFDC